MYAFYIALPLILTSNCHHGGSFLDMTAVEKLFDGAYGAFVNTDSFTVGATAELEIAFKIVS